MSYLTMDNIFNKFMLYLSFTKRLKLVKNPAVLSYTPRILAKIWIFYSFSIYVCMYVGTLQNVYRTSRHFTNRVFKDRIGLPFLPISTLNTVVTHFYTILKGEYTFSSEYFPLLMFLLYSYYDITIVMLLNLICTHFSSVLFLVVFYVFSRMRVWESIKRVYNNFFATKTLKTKTEFQLLLELSYKNSYTHKQYQKVLANCLFNIHGS